MKTVKLKFHNRFGKLDRTIISKIIDTTIIEFLGTLIVNDMDIVESSYCVAKVEVQILIPTLLSE